ncbi:hypothetical protein [Propionivibrio dicarboxylicus]|uniref:Flagellar protein FliT n=1 Tax=Propionivibrio dicarboxylicus TaxID=83767 RepID=A0A1G8HC72_9RHOO|nr:hypothetical protein [Propionivibrio dicarboxylicus]SDI04091.1 hypothetical protein SAMN05660652_02749 [Propionivibrio dicarboxylicus]
MTTARALLEELETSHERMASLADQLDWDGVTQMWPDTARKFADLKRITLPALPQAERDAAFQSLHRVLTLQNRMLDRILPWMEQARPLLQSFKTHPLPAPDAED